MVATGVAGGVEGAGDLGVGEACLAGGGSKRAQVGCRVGLQRAVRGPEQARVAVAFWLAGDPPGKVRDVTAYAFGLRGLLRLALRLEEPGDGLPVEAVVTAGLQDKLVGPAVDPGR